MLAADTEKTIPLHEITGKFTKNRLSGRSQKVFNQLSSAENLLNFFTAIK